MLERFLMDSLTDAPPLRVGLLLDSAAVPAVLEETIRALAHVPYARLVCAAIRDEAPTGIPLERSVFRRRLERLTDPTLRRRLLYDMYGRWDARHSGGQDDPTRPVSLDDLLSALPVRHVRPIAHKFDHLFADDDLEWLAEQNLDVLIRLGFNILKGGVLKSARYGVWSFHHGDNDEYRGGPAHLWELIEDNPVSGVILQVLSERLDDGFVLMKGRYQTERGHSLEVNRRRPYWASSFFMLYKLRELHALGWEALREAAVPPAEYRGRRKIYRTPGNADVLGWVRTVAADRVTKRLRGAARMRQDWQLAWHHGAMDPFRPMGEYARIANPPDAFWADPCVVHHAGDTWVFFEEFLRGPRRGRIVVGLADRERGVVDVRPVLDTGTHLSYPHVFEHDGAWWMIPESADDGHVALWRAVDFPFRWERSAVLFRGVCTDTTAHRLADGSWAFFTSMIEPRGGGWTTCLFVSSALGDPWQPHPTFVVSTAVDVARSAGPLIEHAGKLLRPAQDCSRGYGFGLRWMQVDVLDPHGFRESSAGHVVAPPDRLGGHTWSAAGDYQFIDLTWIRKN